MIALRRHTAFALLAALLIGGLPLLHAAQHIAESARPHATQGHAAQNSAQKHEGGPAAEVQHAPSSENALTLRAELAQQQAACDLCAHILHGTPVASPLPSVRGERISKQAQLRSRVVQATPYHFVIRGPPAQA